MPIENPKPPDEEARIAESVAIESALADCVVAILTKPRTVAAQMALAVVCRLTGLSSSDVMDEVDRRVKLLREEKRDA